MAEKSSIPVKVVRDGYTFGKMGHPVGSVLHMSEEQYAATRNIKPPFVERITATEAKEIQGRVTPMELDAEVRRGGLSPASREQALKARKGKDKARPYAETTAGAMDAVEVAERLEDNPPATSKK